MVSQKPKYCKNFERNSHWRNLSMIMVWERYCIKRFSKTRILFILFIYIYIHISANTSPFGLKFSQMILHTETSKLMYNWSFLFVVLHKPTLLPSTFNESRNGWLGNCLWKEFIPFHYGSVEEGDHKSSSVRRPLYICPSPRIASCIQEVRIQKRWMRHHWRTSHTNSSPVEGLSPIR